VNTPSTAGTQHRKHGPVLERIPTKNADVGGIPVRRAIPTKARRTVGAWCFLDHLGPSILTPETGMNVGPHPHIGLQTFTWMLAGEVMHHDSLGYGQVIRPGQVNLMTAGRGIAHSEESLGSGTMHASQLWIALPESHRHCEPAFAHHPILPQTNIQGVEVTLLAGQSFGLQSPVQVFSELVGADLSAPAATTARIPLEPGFEHAILCLEESAVIEGERIVPGELFYLGDGRDRIDIQFEAGGHLLLIGGTPFEEPVLMWWNFVARTADEISQATEDWNAGQRFGEVAGTALQRLAAPEFNARMRAAT